MKKSLLAVLLIGMIGCGTLNKKEEDDNTSLLLLGLVGASAASSNCASFPTTIVDNLGTWSCSVSGLVYSCSGPSTFSVTFNNVTDAKNSVVLPPNHYQSAPVHRAKSTTYSGTTTTWSYDSQSRPTSANAVTYNTYNSSGYPQAASNGDTWTYTGTTYNLLTSFIYINGGARVDYTASNGRVTSIRINLGAVTTVTMSGNASMCQ